uniref:Disease resistance RPP13-like protein 1 n=1 Tax=Nelumbo nucifera TaxID=4432 RepID=A0A822XZM8_NELNU|nr:TPA_asm: hypothetical protein HUJ06_025963 [Nelumbo nucifera]
MLEVATLVVSALAPITQVVCERLASFLLHREIKLDDNEKDMLKSLMETMTRIQSLTEKIDGWQIYRKEGRSWLRDLKSAAYDTSDLLEELPSHVCKNSFSGKIKSTVEKVRKGPTYRETLERIVRKLDEISKQINNQPENNGDHHKANRRSQTSSFTGESLVPCREDVKRDIVEWLLSGDSSKGNVSVISLVGMVGLGKTTLSQHIYNDENLEHHFTSKAWVSVGKDFNLDRHIKSILHSTEFCPSSQREMTATSTVSTGVSDNGSQKEVTATKFSVDATTDTQALLLKLREVMKNQKFFLVLDDVLNIKPEDWDPLIASLKDGTSETKILVTTQSQKVATMITDGNSTILLKALPHDACWSLFQGAFANERTCAKIGSTLRKKVETKCAGLPLVAKVLGRFLNSKITEEEDWTDILNSELWDLLEDNNEIFRALWESYLALSTQVKLCFTYGSIIPKGSAFDKDKLVHLWMAEGFILPQGERRIENIGNGYFNDLFSRSFFQNTNNGAYGMHDLIHEFAHWLFLTECLRIEDSDSSDRLVVDSGVRHLSILCKSTSPKVLEEVSFCERIRTILLQCGGHHNNIHSIPYSLGTEFRKLRVLDLSGAQIEELPQSIGSAKQLRHIDLSNTPIKKLCKTISRLPRLHRLKLKNCGSITYLPSMKKLSSLRHFHLDEKLQICSMPEGISQLTSLETLSHFFMGTGDGQKIEGMKNMTNLRGSLCILKLESVSNAQEATEAALDNKQYLEELTLKWNSQQLLNPNLDVVDVLRSLKPHENLKKLHISGYSGNRFPQWLGGSSFSNLVNVSLCNFNNCTVLPPLGQLPSLESLSINKMRNVEEVDNGFCRIQHPGTGFPSLTTLQFVDMCNFETWNGVQEGDFPKLQKLIITNCARLLELPKLVWLEFAEINNSGLLESWRDQRMNRP